MNKLAIAYRIYPKVSKQPPIHADDKYKLSDLCLKSFSYALKGVDYKIWAILDGCPKEYENLFREKFDDDRLEIIHMRSVGNANTFGKQIEILLNQDFSDNVYFAEDDYFYLEDSITKMIDLLESKRNISFCTCYDHPDYYKLNIHNYFKEEFYTEEQKWQQVSTTCMTFMTKQDVLAKTKNIFDTYTESNYDASLWMSLTKFKILNPLLFAKYFVSDKLMTRVYLKAWYFTWKQILFGERYKLVSPKPSLGTHMDKTHMAPDLDWAEQFNKYE